MPTTIAIEAFDGEYQSKHMNGKATWHPCQVIGAVYDGEQSRFVILVEVDDGALYISDAECVRRTLD